MAIKRPMFYKLITKDGIESDIRPMEYFCLEYRRPVFDRMSSMASSREGDELDQVQLSRRYRYKRTTFVELIEYEEE